MCADVVSAEEGVRKGVAAGRVVHLSVEERAARGKAARAEVPRSVHAAWEPPPHRPIPVELLEEQAQTRVPELVPIRYGRMLVSPFTFYRGAAYLMASDLAGRPRSGLHVQLCGDAHLSNFGMFAAPDRRLIFSVNDFDETLPGAVRVGREAPGCELRRRGPRPRLRRQGAGSHHGGRARVPRGHGAVCGDAEPRLWYSRIDVDDVLASFGDCHREQRKRAERTWPRRGRRTAWRRSTS